MRIGLVGCTKTKLTRAAEARDLYSPSTLFRGRRAYVERTCDRWFILSAKRGLVDPETVLNPYDMTLVGASVETKRRWASAVSQQLVAQFGRDLSALTFEVHAGHDYRGFGLESGLTQRGATLDNPTKGMGQGRQLAFYAGRAAS